MNCEKIQVFRQSDTCYSIWWSLWDRYGYVKVSLNNTLSYGLGSLRYNESLVIGSISWSRLSEVHNVIQDFLTRPEITIPTETLIQNYLTSGGVNEANQGHV